MECQGAYTQYYYVKHTLKIISFNKISLSVVYDIIEIYKYVYIVLKYQKSFLWIKIK